MLDRTDQDSPTLDANQRTFKQIIRSYFIVLLAPVLLLGPIFVRGEVLFWGTPALQFVPWWKLAINSLRQGALPLWNPYNGMGAPLMANYQSAFFYPPNWLLLLIGALAGPVGSAAGIAWGYLLLTVLHLAWAGLGMAFLLHRLRFGWLGQVIGGLAFGLSGYIVARLSFFSMVWVAAWLPWVILYAEQVSGGFSHPELKPGAIPAWLKLAGCLSMMLLAGHAQLTWYSILLAGLWVLVSGWRAGKGRLVIQSMMRLGRALAYAAAVSAVQLLPTFEYLRQSQRSNAVDLDVALTYSFWPWRFLTIFAPDLFGNPAAGDFWGYASYWEDHLYIGMLPVLLALSTLIMILKDLLGRRRSKDFSLSVFLWLGLIITFILAMGRYTPVFPFLYHTIPGFDMFQAPARYMLWAAFALPILAAIAVDRWRSPTGRGLYWFRLGTAGAFAITLGAGVAWMGMQGIQPTLIRAAALAGLWALGFGLLTLSIPWARRMGKIGVWHWGVIAWTMADLLITGWTLNPGAPLDYYLGSVAQPPVQHGERIFLSRNEEYDLKFSRFLRFDDFRPLEDWRGMRETYLPNSNLLEGVSSANNFDPLVPEGYTRWMDVIDAVSPEVQGSWLAWAGVGAVEKIDLREPTGVRFDRIDGANRWRWVDCALIVPDSDAVWRALGAEMSKPVQPDRKIFLEEQSLLGTQNASGDCVSGSKATVTLIMEHMDRLVFEVDTTRGGWLEIMDTWYPGWYVTVDDEPQSLHRADGLFRAVYIHPGNHEIVIHYRPLGFIFGGLFSILVLLLTILWWIISRRSQGTS